MKRPCIYTLMALLFFCSPALAEYINFSGISVSSLPQTFSFNGGSVTVSEVSSPPVGTASVTSYIPGVGGNGYDSPIGGFKQSILSTGTGPDSWELKFAFSQPEQITIHNVETYCSFEDTTLQSDNAWTQVQSGSPNLDVTGLGTTSLSLVGAYGAAGPFGYGYWSTTTSNLFTTYQLNEAAGGSAGNGIEISVPEPSSISLLLLFAFALVYRSRVVPTVD